MLSIRSISVILLDAPVLASRHAEHCAGWIGDGLAMCEINGPAARRTREDHSMSIATLDHVVVDARDRMDEAVRIYQTLGFQLTPRGYHSLGSINNLAMFGTNYLELLGFGDGGAGRPELAPFPIGLNGLVFKTDDAEATFQQAERSGVPALPARAFSRPVELDGKQQDARFRTTRIPPEASGIGRVYFCEHQTPELVWRPEWLVHPNGAQEIVRVLIATHDAERQATLFAHLFGDDAVGRQPDGTMALTLSGAGCVILAPVMDTLGALGDAAPEAAERTDFMAALTIRVASLPTVVRLLQGVPGVVVTPHRITVPAMAAMNTTIMFEA
jgi:hypothetical protein